MDYAGTIRKALKLTPLPNEPEFQAALTALDELVAERDRLKGIVNAAAQFTPAEERVKQLETALRFYAEDPTGYGAVARAALEASGQPQEMT